MSWATISSNDWVTNNNAQDAVNNGLFILRSGQNIPANDNFMTRAEAYTKLNINDVGGTGTTWITKGEFVSAVIYYSLNPNGSIYSTLTPPGLENSCIIISINKSAVTYGNNYLQLLHSGPPILGDVIYQRANFTYPPQYYVATNLANQYFAYRSLDGAPIGLRLGSNSEIIEIMDCTTQFYQINTVYQGFDDQYTSIDGCSVISNIYNAGLFTTNPLGSAAAGNTLYYYKSDTNEYKPINWIFPQAEEGDLEIPHGDFIGYYDNSGNRVWLQFNSNSVITDLGDCSGLVASNQITVDSPLGSHEIYVYSQYPVTSDVTVQVSVALGGSSTGLYINRWITIYTGNSNANDYIGGDYSDGNASILDISPGSDGTYMYYAF
ncbi:hypothetical protein [Pedobacter sp.]|uniref:hypothetical protein n=1 Tax=Pedobacter sp. TaxID=1411316 RepID=UPI0031D96602